MERNLTIIVSLIFVALLMAAILHYGFRAISRISDTHPELKTNSTIMQQKKEIGSDKETSADKEYRMIIDKTKDEYESFMKKMKSQ